MPAKLLAVFAVGAAASLPPVEAPKDELHGAWAVEELWLHGQDLTDLRGARCVFSGGALVIHHRGEVYRGAYRLRPSAAPRAIDFLPLGASEPQMRGVYRVDGDGLAITAIAGVRESGRPAEVKETDQPLGVFIKLRGSRRP